MFKSKIKKIIRNNLINIPGWRTKRKIIVFESDDWGSNRMPSPTVFHSLLSHGIDVNSSYYDRWDTLESREDLNALFDTLSGFVDKNGNHPVFTFYTIMGNPSYERIAKSNFENYYYESLFDSYITYHNDDLSRLWFKGINENIIRPQFHGREHLNVALWMEALKQNDQKTKIAFENRFYGLKTNTPSKRQKSYLAAHWPENREQLHQIIQIIKDGLELFNKSFGYHPESFVACNYIYPEEIEEVLSNLGVKYIQTQSGHFSPSINGRPGQKRRHYTGQKNKHNQYYIIRNCLFEPSLGEQKYWVDSCMNEIGYSFRWNKPAVISTHRINYVGGISSKNRERGLSKLAELISSILKNWPDVEFLSSDQLGHLIEEDQ